MQFLISDTLQSAAVCPFLRWAMTLRVAARARSASVGVPIAPLLSMDLGLRIAVENEFGPSSSGSLNAVLQFHSLRRFSLGQPRVEA